MIDQIDRALDLAFETLYRFAAAGLTNPRRELSSVLFDAEARRLAAAAADVLQVHFADQPIQLGFGELPVDELALDKTIKALGDDRDQQAAEFLRVFGLVTCRECPPYETEYHPNPDPFFRSQQMADIAGFYQAFGIEPGASLRERPDHITLELEFVAMLLARKRWALEQFADSAATDRVTICDDARMKFQQDHLCWWVPSFSLALRNQAEDGFFADLGRVLAALLPLDRHRLKIAPPPSPLTPVPTEMADACEGCALASQG
jgi:TorA maturation chaperone TorD